MNNRATLHHTLPDLCDVEGCSHDRCFLVEQVRADELTLGDEVWTVRRRSRTTVCKLELVGDDVVVSGPRSEFFTTSQGNTVWRTVR